MTNNASSLQKTLTLIAAILCIIQGIWGIITYNWFGIIGAIIAIVLGVVLLMASGYITDKIGIPLNLVSSIILAVLSFIFGSYLAGILMVIVAILIYLGK